MRTHPHQRLLLPALGALAVLLLFAVGRVAVDSPSAGEPAATSWIVQSPAAADLVVRAGGTITHRLPIIDGVAADLSDRALDSLRRLDPAARIFPNSPVEASGLRRLTRDSQESVEDATFSAGWIDNLTEVETYTGFLFEGYSHYPALVRADRAHELGYTGRGVTVAFIDSGYGPYWNLTYDAEWRYRMLAFYDAIADHEGSWEPDNDPNGHGSHVIGAAIGSGTVEGREEYRGESRFNGIAPNADLVVAQAFDQDGKGRYADVIRALGWIVDRKDAYGIRVLNLSFSARVRSYYWDDPLNQAVMRAWQAGIVVVASAGNTGPGPMTIGVPGNLPYVITVGALTDSYTPANRSDDRPTFFTASGPTYEGFPKPDLLAPGGHITSYMSPTSQTAREHPEFHDGGYLFTMSGTSQAAGVLSGVAALLLEADPTLTPDDLKCRLKRTASLGLSQDGRLTASLLIQGSGLVDVTRAIGDDSTGCANRGLDVDLDLSGEQHYVGRVRADEKGEFYFEGLEEFSWDEGSPWVDVFAWDDAFAWEDVFAWEDAVTINRWVDQD